MDWRKLLLSARGRINRRDFWLGFVLVFVTSLLVNVMPCLGQLLSLLMIWSQVCLHSKRLHDLGRSAWLLLLPLANTLVCGAGLVRWGSARGDSGGAPGPAGSGESGATLGWGPATVGVALGGGLLFLLWVGLSPGQRRSNRYGRPPGRRKGLGDEPE